MHSTTSQLAFKVDPRPAELAQCSHHRWAFPQIVFLSSFLQFLKDCFLVAVCVFAQMSAVCNKVVGSFVIDAVNAVKLDTNWEGLIGVGVIPAAIIIDSSDSVGEERRRGDFFESNSFLLMRRGIVPRDHVSGPGQSAFMFGVTGGIRLAHRPISAAISRRQRQCHVIPPNQSHPSIPTWSIPVSSILHTLYFTKRLIGYGCILYQGAGDF